MSTWAEEPRAILMRSARAEAAPWAQQLEGGEEGGEELVGGEKEATGT